LRLIEELSNVKILFTLDLFPYPKNPLSGIFATNRIRTITRMVLEYRVYGLYSDYTPAAKDSKKSNAKKTSLFRTVGMKLTA